MVLSFSNLYKASVSTACHSSGTRCLIRLWNPTSNPGTPFAVDRAPTRSNWKKLILLAMNSLRFLSVLFSALYANAQIQTPPSNVSTGFVRVPSTGFRALGAAAPVKQISFFYTPTGLVAYDGDIIFGTIEEFNRALINVTYNSISNATDDDSSSSNEDNNSTTTKRTVEKRQPRDRTRFAVAERSNSIFPGSSGIWPGSKVSYRYSNDATENELSPYVEPAIDAWTDAVPCLSFEKLPNSEDTSNDNGVVNIVAHNPNIGACFASIGYGPYSLWMSLDTGGACGVAEVKHEWGKRLLYHSRPFHFPPLDC